MPFFVRWPGRVKAGTQSAQLICLTDLLATCAGILDVKLPESAGEDSISLLPALLGTKGAAPRRSVVHHSINGCFAVRDERWKLCLCPGSGGWAKPRDAEARQQSLPGVQLYDLATDPAETNNVSAAHPDIVAKLTKSLEDTIANGRSTPGGRQPNDAPIAIFKTNKNSAARN